MNDRPVPSMRIRITYAKNSILRYTGNMDMQRSWERTFRRALLPISYSQGFHPQARLHQASALPLGFTSRFEVIDVWLDVSQPLDGLIDRIGSATPPGIELLQVSEIEFQSPPLQTQVLSAEYLVTLLVEMSSDQLEAQAQKLMAAPNCIRIRRDKQYDLRPLIENLEIISGTGGLPNQLTMILSAREAATGRPDEVVDAMGIPPENARIERMNLVFKGNSPESN